MRAAVNTGHSGKDQARPSESVARFVYRPRDDVLWADPVERRSMTQHLDRLCRAGRVAQVEPGRFRAADSQPRRP